MSNPKCDYIFFGDDRSRIQSSTMHLADQIVKTRRVFWFNIYTRMPKLSIGEFAEAFRILMHRSAKAAENQHTGEAPIISTTPLQFPHFGVPARKISGYLGGRFYRKFVRHHHIQNPAQLQEYGAACRPWVESQFRWNKVVDRLETFLQEKFPVQYL